MKKALTPIFAAAVLVTLAASSAHADRQWTYLSNDGSSYLMYNKKTTKREGNIVSGWITKQLDVDKKAMKEQKVPLHLYHSDKWVMAFYEFDCKGKTLRALTGKQDLTGKNSEDITRDDFHAPEPKSLDELLLRSMCKEIK